jgi:hypothetical protein
MALLFKSKLKRRDYTEVQDKMDLVKTWSQTTFLGDIQTASGRDLALFPEGMFSVGAVKVRTEKRLNVKKEGKPGTNATFVFFNDTWYELTAEMPWQQSSGPLMALNHYKYLANPRTNTEAGL